MARPATSAERMVGYARPMDGPVDHADPRARRTREAIIRAFVRLLFERRYETLTVAEVAAAAGVGRATLYEHFRGKREVLVAAMEPVLLPLANAAAGRASRTCVRAMLEHVWQHRATGRIVLASTAAARLQRRLAAMIDARVGDAGMAPASLAAVAAAAAQLAMLRLWVSGQAGCSADVLAQRMIGCGRLVTP